MLNAYPRWLEYYLYLFIEFLCIFFQWTCTNLITRKHTIIIQWALKNYMPNGLPWFLLRLCLWTWRTTCHYLCKKPISIQCFILSPSQPLPLWIWCHLAKVGVYLWQKYAQFIHLSIYPTIHPSIYPEFINCLLYCSYCARSCNSVRNKMAKSLPLRVEGEAIQ